MYYMEAPQLTQEFTITPQTPSSRSSGYSLSLFTNEQKRELTLIQPMKFKDSSY